MLKGGAIPFEKQVIIHAKKRPDLILIGWIGILVLRPSELIVSNSDSLDRLKQQGSQQQFVGTVGQEPRPSLGLAHQIADDPGSWPPSR